MKANNETKGFNRMMNILLVLSVLMILMGLYFHLQHVASLLPDFNR